MYRHILLTAELADEDNYIEEKASLIQKQNDAKLSIIHVIEPLPPVYAGVEIGTIPNYSDAEQALTERAQQMIKPIAERLGIPQSRAEIAYGRVPDEIISYAERNKVDLIVTGSHGRHGLTLLLGSTANALLHHAKCDVLSVRITDK